jgi:anti-sigma factor RsiW
MAKHLSYDVLSRYVEDRLAPEEQAHAERHLARCGRCQDERRWLERIRTDPADRTRLKDSA